MPIALAARQRRTSATAEVLSASSMRSQRPPAPR